MVMNSLLLPLTGLTTIKVLLMALANEELTNWPEFLALNLGTTYNYFITYFIQLTFLSVGFWLLDIPHQIVKCISKAKHNFNQRNKPVKKPFFDTYAYDLGYHSAYGLTAFAIMLLFSTIVPYLPMIAGVFFIFKYCVDKYNLSFVYNSEFRGLGLIFRRVVPLSIYTIFMFQLINIGFFSLKTPSKNKKFYVEFGFAFMFIELILVLLVSYKLNLNKK